MKCTYCNKEIIGDHFEIVRTLGGSRLLEPFCSFVCLVEEINIHSRANMKLELSDPNHQREVELHLKVGPVGLLIYAQNLLKDMDHDPEIHREDIGRILGHVVELIIRKKGDES